MTDRRARNQRPRRVPVHTELVEGAPLEVEGRSLVPLIRLTSRVRRQASLEGDDVRGRGYGFVHMRPVAIVDKDEDGEHYHRIRNETARVTGWLGLAALLIPGLVTLLIYLLPRLSTRHPHRRSA